MQEKVLFQDRDGLKTAEDRIIMLTFLTTNPDCINDLIYLPAEAKIRISKLFPEVKFYLLNYVEDKERVPFYEMVISLIPWRGLKKLCIEMEFNHKGERVADIDVHLCYHGKFYKVSKNRKLYEINRKAIQLINLTKS